MMLSYPKRLIEVDLPIREISAHARREKSIRHGHISTLHIWWARRPLAACRAVLCASLWPDPADEICPQGFRDAAALALCYFADQVQHDQKLAGLCKNHWPRWVRTNSTTLRGDDPACWADLRYGLLDFIADFANWDSTTLPAFLDTARLLTHAAHLTLSGMDPLEIKTLPRAGIADAFKSLQSQLQDFPRPLVVDPFAGGGAIPLEALRVGADAFASDLNPVAVLLNKVLLEYIPKYGNARIESKDEESNPIVFNGLAEAIQYWGHWVRDRAEEELAEFYPSMCDEEIPIAYIWARTIKCGGPGCGAEIPMINSLWLSKKRKHLTALRIITDREKKEITFDIITQKNKRWISLSDPSIEISEPNFEGTVRRGSGTCPICGYTTPVTQVRTQMMAQKGGAASARLLAVVVTRVNEQGRKYRLPTQKDLAAIYAASQKLEIIKTNPDDNFPIPNESLPIMSGVFNAPLYGHSTWASLFSPRQMLSLVTLAKLIIQLDTTVLASSDNECNKAIITCLALALDKQADSNSSLCAWRSISEDIGHTFGRQALPMLWDFVEGNILSGATRDWINAIEGGLKSISSLDPAINPGVAEKSSATHQPLPTDSVQGYFTDPPYYNAVPYADLSDFFYIWLRRTIGKNFPELFDTTLAPKEEEICEMSGWDPIRYPQKSGLWYEGEMQKAMAEGVRLLIPSGIGVIVFAHKSTKGWEAQLQAMVNAGWIITGSWPIDTEMSTRLRAINSATLSSSIHLICRPRETIVGALVESIGDWREVLSELPVRIHSWLPRLANEGIVGADAIFACLGPALEIFSRYSRVEKASGEMVTLKEYLEVVWAAVSREAMSVIFEGADATGFEEDARLTAMWLWTLSAGAQPASVVEDDSPDSGDEEDATPTTGSSISTHYGLEYDTARKIAQGLGAHLERLTSLVEVKGDQARLLSVSERASSLFSQGDNPIDEPRKRTLSEQPSLFSLIAGSDDATDEWLLDQFKIGQTTLDQIHQAMLLFASNRSAALKHFLVDASIGKNERFWRLAQALSALYPLNSNEKRWIDGVLAKKKGFGF